MAGLLDGTKDVASLPAITLTSGIDVGAAALMPGSGQTFYVRGNGTTVTAYADDPAGYRDLLIPSVAKALTYCQSGRGDTIVVLEGHTENIATATSWALKAGVKIIGRGTGPQRPLFTLTAAAATVTVNVANVTIANCQFYAAGPHGTTALTVAVGFTVTAAGLTLYRNDIECGIDNDQLCTNLITLSAAAKDTSLVGNVIHGGTGSVITTVITTTGAVDRLKILGNRVTAEVATAATGVLFDLSNAAIVENDIVDNFLANKTASSKFVIKPHASSTGMVDGNRYFTGDGATAPAASAWSTFTTNYQHGQNFCVTTTGVSAILCPVADA